MEGALQNRLGGMVRVQRHSSILGAVTAAAIVTLLSACSASGYGGASATIPGSGLSLNPRFSDLSRSGISPRYFGSSRVLRLLRHGVNPARSKKFKDLFVDDFNLNAVEIFANKSWTNAGSITSDIDGPDGNWVDAKGNLYVANYAGDSVTEYAPGSSSPSYIYGSDMLDPVAVTTDHSGNVYVGEYGGYDVLEFPQGSARLIAQCFPGGEVEGVALDKSGDVFVTYFTGTAGAITEYANGLEGCSGTTLGVSLKYPGGLVVDKNDNLVVCDQDANEVDIIAPPYGSVSGRLGSRYLDPFRVSIDKKNKRAYVANYGDYDVLVLSYPAGTTQATLNSSNGLSEPSSAVDSQNYSP